MSTATEQPPVRTEPAAPPVPPAPASRLLLGGLLVLLGGAWLLDMTGAVDLDGQLVLSVVVMAVGGVLLLTARTAHHGGLIALGVVLSIVLMAWVTLPDVNPTSGVGPRVVAPTSLTQLQPSYELGAGPLTLDLTSVTIPAGTEEHVTASIGAGELIVELPEGATVDVHATSGVGEVTVLGSTQEGLGVEVNEVVDGSETAGRLVLDLSVGMGVIEVER